MTRPTARQKSLARVGVTLVVVAAAMVALAPTASAKEVHVSIEAREMMMNCPDGKTMCLVVTGGSLSDVAPGNSGTITFTNHGSVAHELKLIPASAADGAHQATGEDQAFATSAEDMEPGTTDTFNFTVPASAGGVYLFCHVAGHESSGMWLSTAVVAPAKKSPVTLVIALLAVGVAAVMARRMQKND